MSMFHVEHTHTDLGPTPTASPEDHLRRRLGAPNPCLVGTPWVVGCPVCAESTDQDILGPRLRECQTYTMPTAVYAWLSEYFTTLVSTAACSANRLGHDRTLARIGNPERLPIVKHTGGTRPRADDGYCPLSCATFITTPLENGAALDDVQRAPGRSGPGTTKPYDRRGIKAFAAKSQEPRVRSGKRGPKRSIIPPKLIDGSSTDSVILAANLAVIKTIRADHGKSERYRIPPQPPNKSGTGLLPRRRLSQRHYSTHCRVRRCQRVDDPLLLR